MSKPVPWSVEGGGFDASEAVSAAAREAGLSVDQWLAAAVKEYAALMGVAPRDLTEEQRIDALARKMGYRRSGGAPVAAFGRAGLRAAEEAPALALAPRNEVGEMIREVSRRLDAFHAAPAAVSASEPVEAETTDGLDPLRSELTRLVDLMSDMRRGAVAGGSSRAQALRGELSTLLEAVADLCRAAAETREGVADADDVADLKRDMRLLRDAMRDLQRAAEEREARSDSVDDMRRQIDALDEDVASLDPQPEAAALDATLRDVSERLVESHEQGLRDDVAAQVYDLLADMRDALNDIRYGGPLRALEEQVALLRRAVEDLAAAPQSQDGALDELIGQLRDVRTLLESAPPPARLDRVESQLADLAARLGRIAERGASAVGEQAILDSVAAIRASMETGGASHVFEAAEQRLAALAARVEEALSRFPADGFNAVNELIADARRAHADDVARLEGLLQAMSERLDQPLTSAQLDQVREVVAQLGERFAGSRVEPQALSALEGRLGEIFERLNEPVHVEFDTSRIEGMIGDIAGRVDATGVVAAELQGSVSRIAQAIELLGATSGGDKSLRAIEAQIADISARLDEPVSAELDTSRLEEMVERMGARIEANGEGEGEALRALERQIGQLSERLEEVDGADSLASLERSVAEIFQHIEQFRETALLTAEHAARKAAREALAAVAGSARAEGDPGASLAFERAIADLRAQQRAAEQRASATLDGLQGVLEKVVERLAAIERIAESASAQAESGPAPAHAPVSSPAVAPDVAPAVSAPIVAPQTVAQHVAPPVPLAPEPRLKAAAQAPAVEPERPPAHTPASQLAARAPEAAVVPDLSDMLLEPGAGKPSASALVLPSADEGADGPRASFIAAVRRAQTAATGALAAPAPAAAASPLEQARARARAAVDRTLEQPRPSVAKGGGRLKKGLRIFVALAIAGALVAVGVKYGASLLENAQLIDEPERHGAVAVEPPVASAQVSNPSISAPASQSSGKIALMAPGGAPAAAPIPVAPAGPASATPAAMQNLAQTPASASPADPVAVGSINHKQAAARPQDLRNAAAAGAPAAQFEMAARYADGRGVTKDLAQAAAWFERAAQQEFAPAQYRLGAMYEKGLGTDRDLDKAREWYQRAAERGHVKAMHNLAVLVAEGAAGKPDYGSAAQWFRTAAEHGVRDSQYNFAILNARGLGVAQDLVQSYLWFSLAAAQGDEDAARKLADVAARLDARQLSRARSLVDNFTPRRPDQSVNEALAPPGGWEFTPEPAARPARPAAPRPRVSSL
jgi:localization factor PodJL